MRSIDQRDAGKVPALIVSADHNDRAVRLLVEKTSQRGSNLSREDRERGGRASAAKQVRDARGQFAGRRDGGSNKPGREQNRDQSQTDQGQQVNRNQNEEQDMDQENQEDQSA